MRARRVGILVFFVLFIAGGFAWRVSQQPKPQTISLPDGSQLTLLKVTHGTNHVCRYGNRWQDLLYPILPQKLRTKFPPRVMTFPSGSGDTVMVWLRHDGGATSTSWPPPFYLAAADEKGLESGLQHSASLTRTLNTINPATTPPVGAAPVRVSLVGGSSSQISGWEQREYPRRAARFEIRVYQEEAGGKVRPMGAFAVRNPRPGQVPNWTAETLPATRRTNELEITLTSLQTGLTGNETGQGPAGEGARSFSRATFQLKENGARTEKWSVCGISASNAAGEVRPGGSYGSHWLRGEHKLDFPSALWPEEPAWKLLVDFARTEDFPSDDLWIIKDVKIPLRGELMEARAVTNLHHAELEFLGVSGAKAKLPDGYAGIRPNGNIHLRTPHPMDGLRIVLVEARDDQGRKLEAKGSTARASMGGRGNTPREMQHGFAVEIPRDAKSLDITFAVTRVRRIEFLAKPVMFESKSEFRIPKSEANPNANSERDSDLRKTKIWSAVTCHRFFRFGDLSPKPGHVQRPREKTSVVGCLAHHQTRRLVAFDGDKSPAESEDKSAHFTRRAAVPAAAATRSEGPRVFPEPRCSCALRLRQPRSV
jgi:hypothetical protein